MPVSELTAMESSELEDRLAESRRELFNLRFQKATGQLDNTARLRHVRKEVARVLTELRQRELGIGVAPLATGAPAAAEETDETPAPARRGRRARRAEAEAETPAPSEEDAAAVDADDDIEEEA